MLNTFNYTENNEIYQYYYQRIKAPIHIIGIVGSKAYGLDTADSDTDYMCVFQHRTQEFLGIIQPDSSGLQSSDGSNDYKAYEIAKFAKLALNCNPNIIELLWLDEYLYLSNFGKMLIDNKIAFLSNDVRITHRGFATAELAKLEMLYTQNKLTDELKYKKAKHFYRIIKQGTELLQTGKLTVKFNNDEEITTFVNLKIKDLVKMGYKMLKKFDSIDSILPAQPNFDKINSLIIDQRKLIL